MTDYTNGKQYFVADNHTHGYITFGDLRYDSDYHEGATKQQQQKVFTKHSKGFNKLPKGFSLREITHNEALALFLRNVPSRKIFAAQCYKHGKWETIITKASRGQVLDFLYEQNLNLQNDDCRIVLA